MKAKKEPLKNISKNKVENEIKTAEIQTPSLFQANKKAIIAIGIISFLAYANTLFHDFTIDDAIVITDNIFVKKGLSGLTDIFGKDTFYGFFGSEKDLVAGGRYRPLTLTVFAFIIQFFGQESFFFHILNVSVFSLLCMAILLFLLRVEWFEEEKNKIFALCAALLFALHPIHTEAVANIKGMDEVLCLLLGISSLIFIQNYTKHEQIKDLAIACVLLFSSVLSKENGIAFAFLNILYVFIFAKQRNEIFFKTALFSSITAIFYIIVRWSIIGMKSNIPSNEILNNPFANASFSEHYGTVFHTWLMYLKLLLFPFPLSHDYYFNQIPYSNIFSIPALLGLICFTAIAFFGVWYSLKRDKIGFFLLFFISTFLLVSNLIFPIGTTMGERFIFIPSLAFIVVFVYFLIKYLPVKMVQYSCIAIAVIFAVLTFQRNKAWKDNYTLFKTDIIHSPNSAKLNNAYGGETLAQHLKINDEEKKREMIADAKIHLQKAIAIHPRYTNAYLLLGNAYFYEKNYVKSIESYQKCLQIAPKYNDALTNIPKAAYELGSQYGKVKNDIPNAIKYFELAMQYDSGNRETLLDLGVAYGFNKQFGKAQKVLEKANEKFPNDKAILQNLITTYLNNNEKEKALILEQQYKKLP